MPINATLVTAALASRLKEVTSANGYPFSIAQVERGRFYEDLADTAELPVACLLAASSGSIEGQQTPAGGKRQRAYQIEVVFDFDSYPDRSRDEVLDEVEWSICKALGGPLNGRALSGKALSLVVGDVVFSYPAPGHSIAVVALTVATTFLEIYR